MTQFRSGPFAEQVRAIFSDEGALSRVVDGYEPRDGQRRMADAVAGVLENSGTLLAEAGTGTGKTLAYLVPAILSGRRVLVSTGTKNLQEQIFFKDLPLLQQALGVRVTATLTADRRYFVIVRATPASRPIFARQTRRPRMSAGGMAGGM